MLFMVPKIHTDSKKICLLWNDVETTATFRPVSYGPWSRNEGVARVRGDLDAGGIIWV